MQIQLNSDNHILGSTELTERVQAKVEHELRHVAAQITRVEVHLNDINSSKGGDSDKRCMLEARVKGMAPISVEHRAPTVDLAVDGAGVQLARAVSNALGKADATEKRGASIRRDGDVDELPPQ